MNGVEVRTFDSQSVNQQIKVFKRYSHIAECSGRFMNNAYWVLAAEGAFGATWVEILAAFGNTAFRNMECEYEMNVIGCAMAAKWWR